MQVHSLLLVALTLSTGCAGPTPHPDGQQETPLENSLGMRMVPIPAGSFVRGNASAERARWDETPAAEVRITRDFLISAEEVTLEQFRTFRPDHPAPVDGGIHANAVSWHEAVAFCEWLSEREGRTYRLPTEAEWEYACRAGTTTEYSSGQTAPAHGLPNAWGVANMHTGVREWCSDVYAPYPRASAPFVDPVGPTHGPTRVVRGGLLDDRGRVHERTVFDSSSSRASMAPSFGPVGDSGAGDELVGDGSLRGVVGTWFASENFERAQGRDHMQRIDNNWVNDIARGSGWSARWRGSLRGPITGYVTITLNATTAAALRLDGETVIDAWAEGGEWTTTIPMVADQAYALELDYARRGTRFTELKAVWSWDGQPPQTIDERYLSYGARELELAIADGGVAAPGPGHHGIGFRVVAAEPAAGAPTAPTPPAISRGVAQDTELAVLGPDPSQPYFRKRHLLPMPPDNATAEAIDAAGFHPSFRGHNHSPALEVLPNGDLLMVVYTSWREYEPGVSFLATRLRHGADQWESPEPFLDLATVNDHASMLWTDWSTGTVWLFWGSPRLEGGFPFQWTKSSDNGVTWSEIEFPNFTTEIGSHSRQPINTALRDADGVIHVSSDGNGGQSLLWRSEDDGRTWQDLGGRTAGRHTTFALLNDDRTLLGLGGKNTDIDGYMPQSISTDGGRTWEVSTTPFPAQGSNQRPSVLRLASGRLVFAADYQHYRGQKPEAFADRGGSYVAFSDDDGASWTLRTLPGAQPHENREAHNGDPTLGYSAMRQAPNGTIHLIGTMTDPCLHFEFNEAWLDSGAALPIDDGTLMRNPVTSVDDVERLVEHYPDGTVRLVRHIGIAANGAPVRHGLELWHDPDGHVVRRRSYEYGVLVADVAE